MNSVTLETGEGVGKNVSVLQELRCQNIIQSVTMGEGWDQKVVKK